MVLSSELIETANTPYNRGVCLSDRNVQVILSAMDYVNDRSQWEDMTDSEWDLLQSYMSDAINNVMSLDSCVGGSALEKIATKARRNTAQSQDGSNQETKVIFESADYDYGSMWDVLIPDRLTIPNDGLYQVTANIELGTIGANSSRNMSIWVNGTIRATREFVESKKRVAMNLSVDLELVVGDYLELRWNSSSTSNPINVSALSPFLSVVRLYE